MREIKFRAWNKVADFLMPWEEFEGYSNDQKAIVGEYTVFIDSEFDLMQYTGLKDKNGKEIYEGDIVEERWPNPLAGGENVDRYEVFLAPSTLYIMKHSSGQQRWDRHLFMRCKEVEVIGNIYENPELLEAEKVE